MNRHPRKSYRQAVKIVLGLAVSILCCATFAQADLIAVDDLFTGLPEAPINANVLGNDFESTSGSFVPTVERIADPVYGTIQSSPDGTFTYQPATGFEGIDVFAYRLRDGRDTSEIATVYLAIGNIQVLSLQEPDLAMFVPGTANRTSVELAARADVAGQNLRLRAQQTDRFNLMTQTSPDKAIETWDPNAAGTDTTIYSLNNRSWQTFDLARQGDGTFVILSDYTGFALAADGTSTGANVSAVPPDGGTAQSWLLAGPNQDAPPISRDDVFTTPVDTPLNGRVLSNDSTTGSDFASFLASRPSHGDLVGIGQLIYDGLAPFGEFDYQPDPGFVGIDQFTYYTLSAFDGAPSRIATVTIVVGDRKPIAVDDVYAGEVDQIVQGNVLSNDFEALDGFFDPGSVLAFGPLNGSFTGIGDLIYDGITPWGTFDYVPDPGFTGLDMFGYRVFNNGGVSEVATVFIAVGPMQIASAAEPDLVITTTGTTNRSTVELETASTATSQDWQIQRSAGDYFRYNVFSTSAEKALETWDPNALGTNATIYRLNDFDWQRFEWISADNSAFQIRSEYTGLMLNADGNQAGDNVSAAWPDPASISQQWLLAGTDQALAPIVQPDVYTTSAGTSVTGNVFSNDTATGFDLGARPGTPPTNGQWAGLGGAIYDGITPWGVFEYQPNPGFTGIDTFTYYALSSADGAPSKLVTVTIIVEP